MLYLRSSVAVTLLMALVAWPLASCALPFMEMTPEQADCCQEMANDCGQMAMPESHTCCQDYAVQGDQPGMKTESIRTAPPVVALGGGPSCDRAALPGFAAAAVPLPEYPPGSLPAPHDILRI